MFTFTMGFAQAKLGVKGGLNVTDFSLSTKVFDKSNQTGFFIGPTLYLPVPILGLALDASALYDVRKANVVGEKSEEVAINQKQISVPVNLRYSLSLGGNSSLFAFAGPQFGFNVGKDIKEIDWTWKKSTISVNIGGGIMLAGHLQLTANYNVACGETGEAKASDILKQDFSAKGHAWQIGLAYYF